MPGLSGAALEARDRLVDTSLETNKQALFLLEGSSNGQDKKLLI